MSQGSADPKTDRTLPDTVPCCRESVGLGLANLIEGPRVLWFGFCPPPDTHPISSSSVSTSVSQHKAFLWKERSNLSCNLASPLVATF